MACVELQCPKSSSESFLNSSHNRSNSYIIIKKVAGQLKAKPNFSMSFSCSNSLKTDHSLPYSSFFPNINHSRNICALCVGLPSFHFALAPSFFCRPASFVACSPSKPSPTNEFDSDSESGSDSDLAPTQVKLQKLAEEVLSYGKKSSSTSLPVPSEDISWLLKDGEDVPTMVSSLPITERYAPHRLLEFVTKKLDSQMFSTAQLKSTLMFWQKKKKLQEDPTFDSSAFEGKRGLSQLHQWTATELTLQHAQLTRIARDVLYLILACSLLGLVRVLEALVATFSSSPPRFAKLLDAINSLDFFTVAFLAYSLRKPIIGILHVDPTNLEEVIQLKVKMWDEMHKFYERQWKVVATLGMGRLLAVVAQTLPSTNAMTKSFKMCWDMLLALPIF